MAYGIESDSNDEAKHAKNGDNATLETRERVAGFRRAYDANHETFLRIAGECEDFTFGEQWSPEDKKEMQENRRPALTINVILRAVAAVFGEYSSMKATIATKSRGRRSFDASNMLNKVLNQVLYDNNFTSEESDLFLDAAMTGRGYFDVRLSDEDDPTGEIKIRAEDNLQIILHPDAKTYDPDGWPAVYSVDYLDHAQMVETYGEEVAEEVDYAKTGSNGVADEEMMETGHTFGADGLSTQGGDSEQKLNKVKVITEQCWEPREAYILIDPNTTDYEVIWTDEMDLEEAETLAEENGLILEKKNKKHPRFYVYTESEVECFNEWSPYRHINKIPYFFYFRKGRTMGMVENLRSPQEQINKGESQELHIVNSTSNGGWQVEENSLVNLSEEELEKYGAKPGLVIVRRRGTAPLEKITPNTIPTGISNLGQKATSNLIGVSGVNEGMLGHTPQNISGKVVESKKQAGQSQLQIPFDNLERTRMFLGRIVLSIIQDYFTEERVLRYTASDAPDDEELIMNQVTAAGQIVNDVSLGRYDVVVSTRPKQDVETDYQFAELMALKQVGVLIPDWHIIEKSHVENRYQIAEETKKLAGMSPSPEEVELAQLNQQIDIETRKQELAKLQQDTAKVQAETQKVIAETNDIATGQNQRFVLGLQSDQAKEQINAQLRHDLASQSSDTQIAKQVLSTKGKMQEKELEAQLGVINEPAPAAPAAPATPAQNDTQTQTHTQESKDK